MKNIETIIVGVTSKKQFSLAVREAQKLSQLFGALIYPVHIIEPLSVKLLHPKSTDEVLDKIMIKLSDEIQHLYPDNGHHKIEAPLISVGNTAKELASIAKKIGNSLIVIGRHSTGFMHMLGKSHAERLVKYAEGPVWIHPDKAFTGIPKRILCPVDFTAACQKAAAQALLFAQQTGADLEFIHVLPEVINYSDFDGYLSSNDGVTQITDDVFRKEAEQQFRRLYNLLNIEPERYPHHVRFGDPSAQIHLFAEETKAELIVVSSSSNHNIEKMITGSTVRHIIHDAKIDILVVK
ncbi:universal stress protein [Lentisphaera profundi]|uniref:Universal stress protein n=1 Tax=Lentisphaera profundi TaxID=1658616 RepID=A0ABY7VY98_9BACT|nr:universal stress protein [Lentisphaera profundi]WDE98185.1 universal stress protein [Lentisphaera profundi]